jgi:hypothetical protein
MYPRTRRMPQKVERPGRIRLAANSLCCTSNPRPTQRRDLTFTASECRGRPTTNPKLLESPKGLLNGNPSSAMRASLSLYPSPMV